MAIKPLHNEREILAKIAEGDHIAFKEIYNHYHENVYAFALWYLKSEQDAEEVVQETFLKIWLKGKMVVEIVNLEKYLRTIAGNKSLDLLRNQARRIKTSVFTNDEETEMSHNDTEESIILKELRDVLNEAIDKLPEQQKKVYLLCQEQGLKNDEVARQLNLSPLTVRTHTKLALRFIREYVKNNTDKANLLAIMVILRIF